MIRNRSVSNYCLNVRIRELAHEINVQSRLITSIVEEGGNGSEEKYPEVVAVPNPDPRKSELEEAVKETIDVLEQSRKSFKSKQLARLRKKLTRVLLDSDASV